MCPKYLTHLVRAHKGIRADGKLITLQILTVDYMAYGIRSRFYPLAQINKALYEVPDPYNHFGPL